MMFKKIITIIALLLLISSAFAYTGFNRYYYTSNYNPSVYYPDPSYTNTYPTTNSHLYDTYASHYYAYNTYTYPSYGHTYPSNRYDYYNYSAYKNYYPYTYYSGPSYPNTRITSPSTYRSITIHGDDWGITYGEGVVCSYYGYC